MAMPIQWRQATLIDMPFGVSGEQPTRCFGKWEPSLPYFSRETAMEQNLGWVLAPAYPDRIAQRQKGSDARYLLANGRGARFNPTRPLGH